MPPICVNCKVDFRRKKSGIGNERMAGSEPYQLFSADLWECPGCGFPLISGFGQMTVTEHYQDNYMRIRATYGDDLYRSWNTLQDRDNPEPPRRVSEN
ncbi:MAG: hypothetical protein NVS1B6_00150 [Steroidobacteraceae bacterium]